MKFVLIITLLNAHAYTFRTSLKLRMSTAASFSFLNAKEQSDYLSACLQRSVACSKKCIASNIKYVEIEFPPNRKSDLSVSETLDTNRAFVREFVKTWSDYGRDLWIIFPDSKECTLASKYYGDKFANTLTSIDGALEASKTRTPKLFVVVNPGFNVDEWIKLAALDAKGIPMIIINGNLDRVKSFLFHHELV